MEHFDNIDKVAFKDLTPEQMACIVKAKAEGNFEYYTYLETMPWATSGVNEIHLDHIYRTIPKPVKKLDIPWTSICDNWKYATLDYDGLYLWTEKPYFVKECGWVGGSVCNFINDLFNIDIEDVEYATSLTERPE